MRHQKYTCKVLSRSWERSGGQVRRWEVRQGRATSGGGGLHGEQSSEHWWWY